MSVHKCSSHHDVHRSLILGSHHYPRLCLSAVRPPTLPHSSLHAAFPQISSASLPKFHSLYGSLLKSHLNPLLRKRDKKREKQRAEEITARKKKLNEPVVVEGPKRGAGRKKRQRKMKAAVRQEEAKRRMEEREAGRKK